jgi:hydrogenase maturation protease
VGPRVIDALRKESLPEGVFLHDGDISGLDLIKFFPEGGRAVIVDAADMKERPAAVKIFTLQKIRKADFTDKFSTHGMALLETLTLAESLGVACNIMVVGVQPEKTAFNLELSEKIKAKIPEIVGIVKELVEGNWN